MAHLKYLLIALLLTGCAARAVETGIIEPRVDEALDESIERFCSLPADIMARKIRRETPEFYFALTAICPETWGDFHARSVASVIEKLPAP